MGRDVSQRVAVTIAVCATAWVVASTVFYSSGGLNPAGLVPTIGCLIALWGVLKSDVGMTWFGTGVVTVSAVLFVFSLGLAVVPAAIALIVGSFLMARSRRTPTA
jgi:hypothetical protein